VIKKTWSPWWQKR